jgi:hypothetical protein
MAAASAAAAAAAFPKVGWLVAGSAPGALLIDFDGNQGGPRPARSLVALDEQAVRDACASKQAAVMLFEGGDPALPIVIGLVPSHPGATLFQSLLAPEKAPAPARKLEARVDGKRVVLEGEDEVVLRCGDASITLHRSGKVVLRGAYIETTAKGVNRIRGGSVKIN